MKTKYIILSLIAIVTLTAVGFTTFQETTEELIIGIWEYEDEPNNKWKFTNEGKCYWLEGNNIQESFTYVISQTSPQCGYQVSTHPVRDFYLKLTDEEGDTYCYQIYGIDNEGLSLSYLVTNSKHVFTKQ